MTPTMKTATLFLFCAGVCLSSALADDELALVPRTADAPVIDGQLSDKCWPDAPVFQLDGFCDRARRNAGIMPSDATEVRLLCDDENLYVAFRCAESQPEGPWTYQNQRLAARGNSHVLGGDHVSIAVDLGRFGFYNYYFFAVNPAGQVYRSFTWPHRYDLVLRDIALPEVTAATRIDDDRKSWSAELRIPLKPMLRHPNDGIPRTIGLDIRRAAYGPNRNQPDLEIYWTGMAAVTGNKIKPYYDHLATWRPLFETYPDYRSAYAAGRGWIQLVFPESFGHVRLASGTLDNKLISGGGSRLRGLIDTRMSWDSQPKDRRRVAELFDAPRMEYWDDLRPTNRPTESPVIVRPPPAGKDADFVGQPSVMVGKEATTISFTVSAATDVAITVRDAAGRAVRRLAAGVLGQNAPAPFAQGQLAQKIAWDNKDDAGQPVPPGEYQVQVALGLTARFDHAIELDRNNWWNQDPTPTAKGLDIDNMPIPTLGKTLGHFAWGAMSYLAVDRRNEELYVQTQWIYDGRTGKKLRDLKPAGPRISDISKGATTGELAFCPVGRWIYMTGPNELWRFDFNGQARPFKAVGRHFIPELWGAHSNPHRGIAVGNDGSVYMIHHYMPHASMKNQVTKLTADGRISSYGFIEIDTSAAGIRVDRVGNVYVGCTVQPAEGVMSADVASGMPKETRELFRRLYGSIVKFGPEGGEVQQDDDGKFACPGPQGLLAYRVQGAKWIRPGYSPMLSRISDSRGGPGCSCRNARFDLDDYSRLFIPDAVGGRIEVTDSNANTIMIVGQRGRPDAAGIEFGWATQVAVSDEAIYAADYLRFRVVRMKLEYSRTSSVLLTFAP